MKLFPLPASDKDSNERIFTFSNAMEIALLDEWRMVLFLRGKGKENKEEKFLKEKMVAARLIFLVSKLSTCS